MKDDLSDTNTRIRLLPEQVNQLHSRMEKNESTVIEVGKTLVRIETNQGNTDRLINKLADIIDDKFKAVDSLFNHHKDFCEREKKEINGKIQKLELDNENTKGKWAGIGIAGLLGGGVGGWLTKLFTEGK